MNIQKFSCPVLHETSEHLFEIKERPWWVAILQVFHLGRWFHYYSPNEKKSLEKRIESVSNTILTGQNYVVTDVEALETLASLHKACSLLTLSELSNLCAKKFEEIVQKKNVLNPSQIFSEGVFEKNPIGAADSFLYYTEHLAKQEDVPTQMEFFAQQLFKLINTNKLTLETVNDLFVAALKTTNWSREQKIKLMRKIFLEQKITGMGVGVLEGLAATIDSKKDFTLDWIYNLDAKFIAAMTPRPSFEVVLERVSPIINNKDGFAPIRASFLLSLFPFFQEQQGKTVNQASQKDCEEFLTFICPKLTEETKTSIVQKLQKDLMLEAMHKQEAKKDILGPFFSAPGARMYLQFFRSAFPKVEKPDAYLAKFYEGLLNDKSIRLSMRFYLLSHLARAFPRPEAGLERGKHVIVSAIVDSLSKDTL